jgi:hypothetical protein
MADRDHAVIEAVARKLRDNGCPNPDALAAEIMAVVRGHGYRYVIEHPPAHPAGPGLPTSGSEAERLLAKVRAEVNAALEVLDG